LTGALVPSARPERSLTGTATYGWGICTNIAVSKPFRGTDPNSFSRPGRVPESASQLSTSVAPFQLA
jgi:hypothetical protein